MCSPKGQNLNEKSQGSLLLPTRDDQSTYQGISFENFKYNENVVRWCSIQLESNIYYFFAFITANLSRSTKSYNMSK